MTLTAGGTALDIRRSGVEMADRFTESARTFDNRLMPTTQFNDWLAGRMAANRFSIDRIPFRELRMWGFEPGTGNLRHASGRFFSVEGLQVQTDYGLVPQWSQPIVHQPEIGILGILVKEIDGVLYCLMSAKMEPGNVNLIQLSPTVQATKSNYTRAHQGSATPYLEYFLPGTQRGRVLVDVLQSEQGSWFYRKCNRNMVVEVIEDVLVGPEFCWLTLGQVLSLMSTDNLVNMDTRTVLSCIPFEKPPETADPFCRALSRSVAGHGALQDMGEVLSWFTEAKTRYSLRADRIPLDTLDSWHRTEMAITNQHGRHFNVIAVSVGASNREVASWTQPLIEPREHGEVAMLVKQVAGTLYALLHIRVEPGYQGAVELAPTVQCQLSNQQELDPENLPPCMDIVARADPSMVRYDTMLSEEGGRFYHAQSRYRIIEVDERTALPDSPDFCWLSLRQLQELLRHSNYVNVQARSLVTSLHSLWSCAR